MNLYADVWQIIASHLPSDDLYSLSLTCKSAYSACTRPVVRARLSYPLQVPYKLTYDQRSTVKSMLNSYSGFKLVNGDVGSGKTITSIAYAIRQYPEPNSKIVMVAPPSLIKMWWNTLTKFFGIQPCVLHSINPKYKASESWAKKPEEKFILVSYKLLGSHYNLDWFRKGNHILIIDESHHNNWFRLDDYTEVITLSATATKKGKYNHVSRHIAYSMGCTIDDNTYELSKKVLGKKLPKISYHAYSGSINKKLQEDIACKFRYTERGNMNLKSVPTTASYISHPMAPDITKGVSGNGGCIKVGRKKFKTPDRGWINNLDIEIEGDNYYKYKAVVDIVLWAKKRGEKVLLFDVSTTWLPYLHKYLISKGIKSHIFSTHYGVTARQAQIEKFKKSGDILMSSTNMLGEGHNVTEANHVIFFSQMLDANKYHQGIGRCWRYPQEKEIHVFLLFGCLFDRLIYEHACGNKNLETENWKELLAN